MFGTDSDDRAGIVKTSVVVPVYNQKKLLAKLLKSLEHQTVNKKEYEVIIVDDGSEDGVTEFMAEYVLNHANVRYFTQSNKGPASARNLGIKRARGEIIAFTDADCVVSRAWVETMGKLFENADTIAVSGNTKTTDDTLTLFTHQRRGEGGGGFATCNAALRKKDLLEFGGFDEDFLFACEDTDLAMRVQRYGQIVYSKDAVVYHPSIEQSFARFVTRIRYSWEGQFLLCKKHPAVFMHRKPLLGVIRVVGLRMFWNDLLKAKDFARCNPLVVLVYIFGLVCQRMYLACLLCLGHGRLKSMGEQIKRRQTD